jgi:hypothetical protein
MTQAIDPGVGSCGHYIQQAAAINRSCDKGGTIQLSLEPAAFWRAWDFELEWSLNQSGLEAEMRRSVLVLLLCVALLTAACGPAGSDQIVIDVRDVSEFDRVSLSSIGTLVITQGDREALEIEAQRYVTRRILTSVRNRTLEIRFQGTLVGEAIPTKGITYRLMVEDLSSIRLSGAGNIRAGGLEAERLEVSVTGVGTVDIDDLQAQELDVLLSGAGTIEVSGEATDQEVILSSVGEYRASDLRSQSVSVRLSGAGRAIVWAEEMLRVTISGLGSVEYYGAPQLDTQISGLGRLVELGEK